MDTTYVMPFFYLDIDVKIINWGALLREMGIRDK